MNLTINHVLKQAITAHKEGRAEDAERLYRTVLKSQPLHPHANHNLGVLAVSLNKTNMALPMFEVAVKSNPKIEQFWVSYIDALIKEKHFDDIKITFRKAKKHGVQPEKIHFLETQLAAAKLRDRPPSKNPPKKQVQTLLSYYRSRRLKEAEELARFFTNKFPKHQIGWKILGVLLDETDRNSQALIANQKSVELAYRDSIAHYNLGNTCQKLDRFEEAEASYRQAIAINPEFAEAHNNLGKMIKEHGRLGEAEVLLERAIGIKPNYADAYNNLALVLEDSGKIEEAEFNFLKAVELGNAPYQSYRNLSRVKKFVSQDEHYKKMLELHASESASDEQRCAISFALAKACEDTEDFEQAFKYYAEGNKLRKMLLNYDKIQDEKLFSQIRSSYPQIEQNSLNSEMLSNNLTPVFIVGLPRSGTTLVEQIISSHTEVKGAGELIFASKYGARLSQGLDKIDGTSLSDFRKNYLKNLQNVSDGNLIVTDKMPQNFLHIGLLAAAFTEAKIVNVKRDSAAVCWSNYKHYFTSKSIGFCYALDDIVNYHKLYEHLMDFWTTRLSERIYNLDYELLTVNQESETRQLINYLGLEWDDNCLSPENNTRNIATASNLQVRKKVYQGSSEQWKKYESFLNGAFDTLA